MLGIRIHEIPLIINIFENLCGCVREEREQFHMISYIKEILIVVFYFSVFIKLDGLGSPLRFIFEGGLRPDGFGIPVEPIVILVRVAVATVVFTVALFVLGVLIPIVLFRLWALPLDDADDML